MNRLLGLALAILLVAPLLASEIDGTWAFIFDTEAGDRPAAITLKVDGRHVSGKVEGQTDVAGTYSARKFEASFPFYSEEAGLKADVVMKGTFHDGKITGEWEFSEYSGTFSATKKQ